MEVREQAMGYLGETGKGNIICKGPEAVVCLACSKESEEVHMAAVEWGRGKEVMEIQTLILVGHSKSNDFYSQWDKENFKQKSDFNISYIKNIFIAFWGMIEV